MKKKERGKGTGYRWVDCSNICFCLRSLGIAESEPWAKKREGNPITGRSRKSNVRRSAIGKRGGRRCPNGKLDREWEHKLQGKNGEMG